MTGNIKRFPDGTAKPFLSPAEYSQLRDDDRFLYNEGIGMTSQTAREALIEEVAAAIKKPLPDFPYSTRLNVVSAIIPIIARIEAEALTRGRMEGAKAMQEAAAEKLKELHGYPTQTYEPGYRDISTILAIKAQFQTETQA